MKRPKDTITSPGRDDERRPDARDVPLMVPHGGGQAGRDFESAFDVLPGDEKARDLWRRARVKKRVSSAS